MRRVLLAVVVVLALLPTAAMGQAGCGFQLGFKAIADQIPAVVGQCLENEHANPQNGDALQKTSGGLLVWRKADNFTAFTDGYRSWVNGPFGLQQRLNTETFDWEARTPAAASAERVVVDQRLQVTPGVGGVNQCFDLEAGTLRFRVQAIQAPGAPAWPVKLFAYAYRSTVLVDSYISTTPSEYTSQIREGRYCYSLVNELPVPPGAGNAQLSNLAAPVALRITLQP